MPRIEIAQLDAVRLCAALLYRHGVDHGFRLLVIKGDAPAHHGLRPPHVPQDVDVLVDPPAFDDYVHDLEHAGWKRLPATFQTEHFSSHSVTMTRDGWPHSIDIHRHFPGFLQDPKVVFEALWERRTPITMAHQPCDAPDRLGSLLLLLLHDARSLRRAVLDRTGQSTLGDLALAEDELSELAALAQATGCASTLAGELALMGVPVQPSPDELASAEYRSWLWKRSGAALGTVPDATAAAWMGMLARTPWRDKPRVALRALWPTRSDVLTNSPRDDHSTWTILRARLSRLVRGSLAIPRVWRRRNATMRASSAGR
ncbi:hypothetical protein P0L94_10390 [Microbacter sp. GSS18]|nr:hypothetical protein P0L94_10390 [Microbacter sp. GSS18]